MNGPLRLEYTVAGVVDVVVVDLVVSAAAAGAVVLLVVRLYEVHNNIAVLLRNYCCDGGFYNILLGLLLPCRPVSVLCCSHNTFL